MSQKEENYLPFSLSDGDYGYPVLKIKEIVEDITNDLFIYFKDHLISKPVTYIVSAVWGEIEGGNLTPNQEQIYERITPRIGEIIDILELDEINEDKRFAVEYLIRGLIISKIAYMIETFKKRAN